MPTDPYAEFQRPTTKTASDPYAEFAKPASTPMPASQTAQPAKPGFFGRLYQNTVGPVADLVGDYSKHVQENQPQYGLASGFPAVAQTLSDIGSGIVGSTSNAVNKTGAALKKGDYIHALQQAPGVVPLVGPAAVQVGEDSEKGNYGGALGGALGLGLSMAAPKIIEGAGRLLKAPAPAIAEQSLGIRGASKAFGAKPGEAVLNETRGVRPSTVEKSATAKLGDLNSTADKMASQSKDLVSLEPARGVVNNAIRETTAGNSTDAPRQLVPMRSQLTTPVKGFIGTIEQAPRPMTSAHSPILDEFGRPVATLVPSAEQPATIAPLQSASDALRMKRQFGKDFVDVWKPADTDATRNVAKGAYHALDQELDKAIPGFSGINQRISSLIPVANRAKITSLNANSLQRMLGRVARPTGALTGMVGGAIEGGRAFGPLGALGGGAIGLGLPELVSSPTGQMIAARSLNATGNAVKAAAPIAGNAARAASLIKTKRQQE